MILRSIELSGWRCFVSPVAVGSFVDGLNIIHGPNGIGKSTLMMALARGLFDNHNVGGAEIKTLRSWGRALTPKVTIEFEQGAEAYRLHKQFLVSPFSILAQKENGQFVPVAENRAADERAREILAAEASARGATDQRHWGLAQVLWAPQGNLKINELAAGTRATIQETLGKQIAGARTESLEKRINDRFLQFFTSKGKLRSGASAPSIVNLTQQLDKERRLLAGHQQRLKDFDNASRQIEHLKQQASLARQNQDSLQGQLTKAREKCRQYEVLLAQAGQLRTEAESTRDKHAHLTNRISSLQKTIQALKANQILQDQIQEDLPIQNRQLMRSQEESRKTSQAVQSIRRRRHEITAARQMAQWADRLERYRNVSIELERRLHQIKAAEKELQRLKQSLQSLVAPNKQQLKQINLVARRRDDARLKLDAALITVELDLEADMRVHVTQAEHPGTRPVSKDTAYQIQGSPDVAFEIPGVGKFRATGPAGDSEQLRHHWELNSQQFAELTQPFGTDDPVALETLHHEAAELNNRVAQSEFQLLTLLDGHTIEDLRAQSENAKTVIEQTLAMHETWRVAPPDPVQVAREADEIETNIGQELEQAESADDQARLDLQSAQQKTDALQTKLASAREQAESCQQRLSLLRDDGLSDDQRSDRLTELALQRDTAQGKLNQVQQRIHDLGDNPAAVLAKLETKQESFAAEALDAARRLHTESGRLEQITSEAPYSALVTAEEEIARLEEEIERQQLQIDAVRLLHQTVAEQKQDVMQSLIDPIRKRADAVLQRIGDSRFEGVRFDKGMLPTGIAPMSHDAAVTLEQISGGEQEQVHFAVRMALADVAFPRGRQMVVLDDVFTYTDAARLGRIAAILDEFAERFQIVLLTCHPERYRGLENANFIDLERITASCVL